MLLGSKLRRIFPPGPVCCEGASERACESSGPLNNVILRSGNTSASKNLHFPEVEATVLVHLFDCAAPLKPPKYIYIYL